MFEKEAFVYYLQTLYQTHHIPIGYGFGGQRVHRFEPFDLGSTQAEWIFINKDLHEQIRAGSLNNSALYYVSPSKVYIGIVRRNIAGSSEFVFIGPAADSNCNLADVQDYLFKSGLNADDTKKLTTFLMNNKLISHQQFLNLLCNINTVMNGTILKPEELLDLSDNIMADITLEKTHVKSAEQQILDFRYTEARDEFIKLFIHALKNGDTDTLTDLWEMTANIPNLMPPNNMTLRDFKNLCIGALYVNEYVALESGLSSVMTNDIKQYHVNKIEVAQDYDKVTQIIRDCIMEFAEHIKNCKSFLTDDPSLNRIIYYIQTNITEKLTSAQISHDLKISQNYIFSKFKKHLNTTLSDFILQEKIKKSVHLLLFTEKSLVEISNHLSFSSQSYFQKTFKQVMKMTPTEFRKKNRI